MGLEEFVAEEQEMASWLEGVESQILSAEAVDLHSAAEPHAQHIQDMQVCVSLPHSIHQSYIIVVITSDTVK